MKIAIIGASGFIGSALTNEALARGHQVNAIVSRPERLTKQPDLEITGVDVLDTSALTQALRGADVVITAFSGHAQSDVQGYYVKGFTSILAAATDAATPRLLVVGGAATLLLPDGSRLLDSPDFPPEYRGTAEGASEALALLKQQSKVKWSFLSPAAEIFPGDKTEEFRLGDDYLLADAKGESRISTGDYAVAMLDEAENPRHPNQRFCVAY